MRIKENTTLQNNTLAKVVLFILKEFQSFSSQENAASRCVASIKLYAPFLTSNDKDQLLKELNTENYNFLREKSSFITASPFTQIEKLFKDSNNIFSSEQHDGDLSTLAACELIIQVLSTIQMQYLLNGKGPQSFSLEILTFIDLALDDKQRSPLIKILTENPAFDFLFELEKKNKLEVFINKEFIVSEKRNQLEKIFHKSKKKIKAPNKNALIAQLFFSSPLILENISANDFKCKVSNQTFSDDKQKLCTTICQWLDEDEGKESLSQLFQKNFNVVNMLVSYENYQNVRSLIEKKEIIFDSKTADDVPWPILWFNLNYSHVLHVFGWKGYFSDPRNNNFLQKTTIDRLTNILITLDEYDLMFNFLPQPHVFFQFYLSSQFRLHSQYCIVNNISLKFTHSGLEKDITSTRYDEQKTFWHLVLEMILLCNITEEGSQRILNILLSSLEKKNQFTENASHFLLTPKKLFFEKVDKDNNEITLLFIDTTPLAFVCKNLFRFEQRLGSQFVENFINALFNQLDKKSTLFAENLLCCISNLCFLQIDKNNTSLRNRLVIEWLDVILSMQKENGGDNSEFLKVLHDKLSKAFLFLFRYSENFSFIRTIVQKNEEIRKIFPLIATSEGDFLTQFCDYSWDNSHDENSNTNWKQDRKKRIEEAIWLIKFLFNHQFKPSVKNNRSEAHKDSLYYICEKICYKNDPTCMEIVPMFLQDEKVNIYRAFVAIFANKKTGNKEQQKIITELMGLLVTGCMTSKTATDIINLLLKEDYLNIESQRCNAVNNLLMQCLKKGACIKTLIAKNPQHSLAPYFKTINQLQTNRIHFSLVGFVYYENPSSLTALVNRLKEIYPPAVGFFNSPKTDSNVSFSSVNDKFGFK